MQSDKFLLARYAQTCLRLFQTKQILTSEQQQIRFLSLQMVKQLHLGLRGINNNILANNSTATTFVGVFSQPIRSQHFHLPRVLLNKQILGSRHNSFQQPHISICTQSSITPLRGKYPTDTVHEPLCSERARELVYNLKDSEREAIKQALLKYDAERQRAGFEAAKAPPPSMADLRRIAVVNAVPFIAFGFLDNFVMIVAGDSIESVFGAFMCISTMAAAGLGNTVSDILGIGSAYYVERGCEMMGFRLPDLTPVQMEMKSSRHSANFGRIVGITIGCLLGMVPLLFMKKKEQSESPVNTKAVTNVDANVNVIAKAEVNPNVKPVKS
ncbi:transmembrane protein 65 isoform X3 [Ceratitis capitata]|uniref:transmembrane protein 65 isoform X3 n=1 Tax=Ceratitis capitata TaxID=7213 RepID=UPI0006187F96|nr:transmembrane protein 65 isoform X3 [Ceratitis capitata]